MKAVKQEVNWLNLAQQRKTVITSLYKPMTGTQLLAKARTSMPRLQLQDIWFHLRSLSERQMAYCLTPWLSSGNLYFLTDWGRKVVAAGYGHVIADPPTTIDWLKYASVARAKIRRHVLLELARQHQTGQKGRAASEIRRRILDKCPVAFNPTFRALTDLTRIQLTKRIPNDRNRKNKLYALTPMGRRIVDELER